MDLSKLKETWCDNCKRYVYVCPTCESYICPCTKKTTNFICLHCEDIYKTLDEVTYAPLFRKRL